MAAVSCRSCGDHHEGIIEKITEGIGPFLNCFCVLWAGLWIRIGSVLNRACGSGFGIRIRIQEGKNDPQK